jgi:E3 ubiquitin-protein ligase UHRF1
MKAHLASLANSVDFTGPAPTKPKYKRKVKVATEPTRRSSRVRNAPAQFAALSYSDSEDERPTKRRYASPKSPKNSSAKESDAHDHFRALFGPKGNGKVFGELPAWPVGSHWEMRIYCGWVGVHPPPVSGIFGGKEGDGAYSIALSAGYPEDRDNGDSFSYTGSGGRELQKKNLRTAPQSKDQVLERGNLALYNSFQSGRPIRVIRGYKAALGPVTGYRYDGLYKCVKAYEAPSKDGRFVVWKFDFERLPGQLPADYDGMLIMTGLWL